jgi:hypothetical protein
MEIRSTPTFGRLQVCNQQPYHVDNHLLSVHLVPHKGGCEAINTVSVDEAHYRWNEEKNSRGVNTFDLSKLLALGRFDMEEEEHRKQCKATNRQVEVEAPSPCPNRVSTRRLADTKSTYT